MHSSLHLDAEKKPQRVECSKEVVTMDKTYAVLSDYNERGATLHIKAYGQDIASFWLHRDALLDLSREIRRKDVLLSTK